MGGLVRFAGGYSEGLSDGVYGLLRDWINPD